MKAIGKTGMFFYSVGEVDNKRVYHLYIRSKNSGEIYHKGYWRTFKRLIKYVQLKEGKEK